MEFWVQKVKILHLKLDSFTVLPGASYELYDRSKEKESAVEGQTQGFPVWTK